jgi:hypothetical protein
MNQSILFPDSESWNEERQCVLFPAQQSGMLIECLVSLDKLSAMCGQTLRSGDDALQKFKALRFDLEELAEELIEDEQFNPEGQVEL